MKLILTLITITHLPGTSNHLRCIIMIIMTIRITNAWNAILQHQTVRSCTQRMELAKLLLCWSEAPRHVQKGVWYKRKMDRWAVGLHKERKTNVPATHHVCIQSSSSPRWAINGWKFCGEDKLWLLCGWLNCDSYVGYSYEMANLRWETWDAWDGKPEVDSYEIAANCWGERKVAGCFWRVHIKLAYLVGLWGLGWRQ